MNTIYIGIGSDDNGEGHDFVVFATKQECIESILDELDLECAENEDDGEAEDGDDDGESGDNKDLCTCEIHQNAYELLDKNFNDRLSGEKIDKLFGVCLNNGYGWDYYKKIY